MYENHTYLSHFSSVYGTFVYKGQPSEPEIPGSNPGGPATDLKFPIILFDLGENFNVKMHDLNF